MALFQERHRFGASRFQLSGSPFGSHEPYYATARMIYPLFMRDSISNSSTTSGSAIFPRNTGSGSDSTTVVMISGVGAAKNSVQISRRVFLGENPSAAS